MIALKLSGMDNTKIVIEIDQGASVSELRQLVKMKWHLDEDSGFEILSGSRQLADYDPNGKENHLSDYNLKNHSSIYLVFKLHGGGNVQPGKIHVKDDNPPPKVYDSDVELTDDSDTIYGFNDEQRAKMPCGHAVSPGSLTDFVRAELGTGAYEIKCKHKSSTDGPFCNKLWEFSLIERMAVLSTDEIIEFESKISENYRLSNGIQKCPKCSSFCTRASIRDQRVVCRVCTRKNGKRYEFCWFCLNTWNSSETSKCGNTTCDDTKSKLLLLEKCPLKDVVGVQCPSTRACPNCGLLIEHIDNCKQMTCRCNTKFCFICLKKAVDGKFECGSFYDKCQQAPVQKEIPHGYK